MLLKAYHFLPSPSNKQKRCPAGLRQVPSQESATLQNVDEGIERPVDKRQSLSVDRRQASGPAEELQSVCLGCVVESASRAG